VFAVGLFFAATGLGGPCPSPASAQSPAPAARRSTTDDAITRWTQRTGAAPAEVAAWVALGDAFMQKVRETADPSYYRRTEAAYEKALAANPRHVEALIGLAWVHGGLHEFEQSTEWAQKALAIDPSSPSAHGLLGDAALELGDYDAAFEHYQKMLDLRPALASYSRGAQLLWLMGDTRKALWMMDKAVKAGGPYAENTSWARAQLGLMLWRQGALLAAEHALDTLAWCYYKAERYEDARKAIRKALARRTPDAEILFHAGMIHARLGDRAAAQRYLYQALSLNPHFHPAHAATASATLAQVGGDPSKQE
jgi:tetratricopeptide (TPR) repeat protein